MLTRRHFLASAAFAAPAKGPLISLGLGNYGLRALKTPDAIRLIAGIGYDSIEFAMMSGYPTEAAKVSSSERREVRALVRDLGLAVPSLLEQIFIIGDEAAHKAALERIKRDAQFGHDVKPGDQPPFVQTHLGGKSEDWERMKNMVVDRLHDWAEAGRSTNTVICIKGHNLNLMDTAERSQWVMRQMKTPWLKLLYDYSHYEAIEQSLGHTMDLLLPYTAMISIKDARPYADRPGFERLLPGDGKVDYVDYYRRLIKAGWSGHTVVEISGQVHSRPGYDPVATAKKCYLNIAPKMEQAGVRRPERGKV